MNPDASGSRVVSVRATQKGNVLILLDKGSNAGFTAEVKKVVEGLGEVRADPKKVTLGIHDLDPLTTEVKVKVELRKDPRNEHGCDGPEPKPKGTEARRSGASRR